jgi:hypothetical protein
VRKWVVNKEKVQKSAAGKEGAARAEQTFFLGFGVIEPPIAPPTPLYGAPDFEK